MNSQAEIRFDGWTLLRQSGELQRDGRRTRLQDHPLKIFEALLARPGELVTREELIARLWPNQVVDFDTALNTSVRRLRAALGDDADTPRYIETVPRRGYRFIGKLAEATVSGPPEPVQPPPAMPRPRARSRLIVLAAGAALAGAALLAWWALAPAGRPSSIGGAPPSIVVLPLVDLVSEGDSQLFADGLTEELINRLAQLEGLQVIARTSAFAYQWKDANVATVAKDLGVSHVLEGSVRRSGNQLRVTAQLIDGRTGTHLWSRNYDRRMGDVFEIQDDIAAQVATALEVTLDPQVTATQRPDPEAYEEFMVGRHLFGRRGPGDVMRAREHFERAIAIDPDFARAWSGLASATWIAVTDGSIDRAGGLAQLEQAARRALALDPRLAEPYVRLAQHAWAFGDRESVRRFWQTATELEPGDPLVMTHAAARAKAAGRYGEGIEILRGIMRLDPLSIVYRHNLAVELYHDGQFEEAVTEARRTAEIFADYRRTVECSSLLMLGRFAEARAVAARMPDAADALQCRALAEHGLGARGESDAALAALVKGYGDSRSFEIAEVYGFREESDEAFRWLQANRERCARAESLAPSCLAELRLRSPLLVSLRDDPRWGEFPAAP